MKLRSVRVVQVLVFRSDQIPLQRLIARSNLEELGSRFSFSNTQLAQQIDAGTRAVVLEGGSFESDLKRIAIPRLVIDDRRILVAVEGSSNDAKLLYFPIVEFLAKLDGVGVEQFDEPVIRSEESEVVAELDFSFDMLVAPGFWKFMTTEVAKTATTRFAGATLMPAHLSFYVEYQSLDDTLEKYQIILTRKEFTLEPRSGVPIQDQVYYSKAPFDTETHVKVLSEIEANLSHGP